MTVREFSVQWAGVSGGRPLVLATPGGPRAVPVAAGASLGGRPVRPAADARVRGEASVGSGRLRADACAFELLEPADVTHFVPGQRVLLTEADGTPPEAAT